MAARSAVGQVALRGLPRRVPVRGDTGTRPIGPRKP